MKDRYVYPAIFEYHEDGICVTFPDLPGCITSGDNEEQASLMGKEAMALHLNGMEKDGDSIPEPSKARDIKLNQGECLVMLDAYMPFYREVINNVMVKVYCTIPQYLKVLGLEHNVNFSQILANALKEKFLPVYTYDDAH